MIRAASGAVRHWDVWNAFVESVTGFVRPILPSLTRRPNRSRSSFEHGGLPVSGFHFEWNEKVLNVWNGSHKIGPAA